MASENLSASLTKWKSRVRPRTFQTYLIHFGGFMKWLEENGGDFSQMTPKDLLEYQRNSNNGNDFDILDLAQNYINTREWRYNSKKSAYGAIRSFFMHNRAPLPYDRGFIIRSDIPPVEAKLKIENIRDLILSSNKCYRAVFTSMFQGGMDIAGFLFWNTHGYRDLSEQLAKGADPIRVQFPGRKKFRNIKPFHSYITRDAIDAIRAYLPTRPTTDNEGQPTTAIFYNRQRDPITENAIRFYWLRHLERIGLIDRSHGEGKSKRYGYNTHELRDNFRSQWERSPAKSSVAEFAMGHAGDPLGYEKASKDPDFTRQQYKLAAPMLQILTAPDPYGLADTDTVEQLRTQLENQQQELDTMKQILENRGEPITNGAMKFQRLVQALEASFPDTEEGYNRLTAALHKLADKEEQ